MDYLSVPGRVHRAGPLLWFLAFLGSACAARVVLGLVGLVTL